jgi:hypothetical protein
MRAALFSYVRERDALCCRVGSRPDDPGSDPVIMTRTRTVAASRVERRWTATMSSDGLEGVADVGPYGAQLQVRRRPVPVRSTALGLLPQRPAWVRTRGGSSHAVNSGRDGVPPASRLHLTL